MAAGTSFAIMMPTTIRSFIAHYGRKNEGTFVFVHFIPGLIVGVLAGVVTAHSLHSDWLRVLFSILLLFVAVSMLAPRSVVLRLSPSKLFYRVSSFFIGGLSAMLGIGGSTLTMPLLLSMQVNIREAIFVSVMGGMIISSMSCVAYIVSGMHAVGLPPHSIGYLYWPAALCTAAVSTLCVPLGVKFSHSIPTHRLRMCFSVLLLLISIHSVWSVVV